MSERYCLSGDKDIMPLARAGRLRVYPPSQVLSYKRAKNEDEGTHDSLAKTSVLQYSAHIFCNLTRLSMVNEIKKGTACDSSIYRMRNN